MERALAMHDDVVRNVLPEFGGREVETAGDSFLHSGEVVRSQDHVGGLAVHAAARIVEQAQAGEVLVSGTTRDLAEGTTGLEFESRGRFSLKGLTREHELFSVSAG